ncbi:MAG: hypothetical protein M3Y31_04260, partial [Gemmatimonadota bacterium]|nr:hypothetical protein [Gemmatimonadota bacterium]
MFVTLLALPAAPQAAAQVQPFVSAGLVIPAGALAEPAPALDYGDAGLGMQLDGGIALGFQSGAVDVRLFGTYARMGRDFDALNSEFADAGVDVQAEGSAQVIGGGLGIVYYFPAQLTG